jgi:hypothetical protein
MSVDPERDTRVNSEFGLAGIYSLAAVVGIADIDPFVLNLAQGGTSDIPNGMIAAAIRIATSSNNHQDRICCLVCRWPSHSGERWRAEK